MLQTLLTWQALEGHQKALGHSRCTYIWTLEVLQRSDIWSLRHSRQLSTGNALVFQLFFRSNRFLLNMQNAKWMVFIRNVWTHPTYCVQYWIPWWTLSVKILSVNFLCCVSFMLQWLGHLFNFVLNVSLKFNFNFQMHKIRVICCIIFFPGEPFSTYRDLWIVKYDLLQFIFFSCVKKSTYFIYKLYRLLYIPVCELWVQIYV